MPRQLYYMIPFISGGIFVFIGFYMYLKPEEYLKKQKKDTPLEIAKAKKRGVLVIGCGLLMIFVEVFRRI